MMRTLLFAQPVRGHAMRQQRPCDVCGRHTMPRAYNQGTSLAPRRGVFRSTFSVNLFPRHRFRDGISEVRTTNTRTPVARMYGPGGGRSPIPPVERLLSILPYLLPVLDSLSFGQFVFNKVPLLASIVLAPLYPLYVLYRGVPFLAFGVFLALYLLVVRNFNVSRYIRFNTYQALMLDIALIFPQLLSGLRLGAAIPASIVEICTSAVFYAATIAVGYAVVANVRGELPDQIPAVSESVYNQMGPM